MKLGILNIIILCNFLILSTACNHNTSNQNTIPTVYQNEITQYYMGIDINNSYSEILNDLKIKEKKGIIKNLQISDCKLDYEDSHVGLKLGDSQLNFQSEITVLKRDSTYETNNIFTKIQFHNNQFYWMRLKTFVDSIGLVDLCINKYGPANIPPYSYSKNLDKENVLINHWCYGISYDLKKIYNLLGWNYINTKIYFLGSYTISKSIKFTRESYEYAFNQLEIYTGKYDKKDAEIMLRYGDILESYTSKWSWNPSFLYFLNKNTEIKILNEEKLKKDSAIRESQHQDSIAQEKYNEEQEISKEKYNTQIF